MLNLFDAAPISTRRKTGDGYLLAHAKAARAGVQTYAGFEVKRPDLSVVHVMRPESEVFDRTSINTYGSKPITLGHPPQGVTAETWRQFAVGHVGEGVVRDGEFVGIPLMLSDAAAIRELEAGTKELSVGYTCDLSWEAGSANGVTWDAVQRGIRVNHVALVPKGRAGAECRIADAAGPAGTAFIDHLPSPILDQLTRAARDIGSTELFRVRAAANTAERLAGEIQRLSIPDAASAVQYANGLKDRAAARLAQMGAPSINTQDRTNPMNINDSIQRLPDGYRSKVHYMLANLRDENRFVREDAVRNTQSLLWQLNNLAQGNYNPGYVGDFDNGSVAAVIVALNDAIEKAQNRN